MIDYKKLIREYLKDSDSTKLYFSSLLTELTEYQPQYMINKAVKVYRLCIEKGKLKLANKIYKKYKLDKNREIKYDLVMSFGYLLKNINDTETSSNGNKE